MGKAVNGFTLTQGNFRREVQVEFATGELSKQLFLNDIDIQFDSFFALLTRIHSLLEIN